MFKLNMAKKKQGTSFEITNYTIIVHLFEIVGIWEGSQG
jgi:hypothetical protein